MPEPRNTEFEQEEQETPLGTLVDGVLRKVSVLRMVDYYLGSSVDYPGRIASLFFSDEAPSATLEKLKSEVESEGTTVVLEEADEEKEANGWVIRVGMTELPGAASASDVSVSGNIEFTSASQGDIPVSLDTGEQ